MIVRPTTDDRSHLLETHHWSVAQWRWPAMLGLFLVALLPRVFGLDAQSLWLDEGSTWQTIRQSWGRLLLELGSPVSAYPLYHLLLKGWVGLFGDSEWALRLPSALAGAGAVVAICFAAAELQAGTIHTSRRFVFPLVAALLLLTSPFALWYAQEAKVYSLLLMVSTLFLWSLLRVLRHHTRRAWFIFGALALTSVFVHRLAVLLLIAAWASYLLTTSDRKPRSVVRGQWALLALASLVVVAAMVLGLRGDKSETGAYIPANPLQALWLTFARFSVDRWPGDLRWWWLVPWIGLALWGFGFWILDFRLWIRSVSSKYQKPSLSITKHPEASAILFCFVIIPLVLFLTQLTFTRVYEARYLIVIYPAWVLLLAYPVTADHRHEDARMRVREDGSRQPPRRIAAHVLLWVVLAAAVTTNTAVLAQPEKGLFSGDPVKEQYRDAIRELARRVHPDDLVVLHPAYLRPLYDYYMQRFTTDPPPDPVAFGAFKQGQEKFTRKEWDAQRKEAFAGYTRSFLLIAPDHARTVDVPKDGDEYGLVGLYFQYSREQKKWPCGIWRFNGAHLLCQDSPETYETGQVIRPATSLQARFGAQIVLEGYTLKATVPGAPGVYRAGGTLPITLFWDVTSTPTENFSMFLHLCRDCDVPPAAGTDGPPLEGYLPTRTWLPGKPVHDERAIPLPRDLPPGRYTLLLGVYPPGDPSPAARLPVRGERVRDNHRLVLGTVEVVATD